jgi:hypothetical protein
VGNCDSIGSFFRRSRQLRHVAARDWLKNKKQHQMNQPIQKTCLEERKGNSELLAANPFKKNRPFLVCTDLKSPLEKEKFIISE